MKYYILIITYSFPSQQVLESFPEPSDLEESGRYIFCYSQEETGEVLRYIPDRIAFEERHRHDTVGVLIGQGMPNSSVFMTREGHPKESSQEISADGRSHWRPLGFARDDDDDDPPARCLSDHSGNAHCLLDHDNVRHCDNCSHCHLNGFIKCFLDHTNNCNILDADIAITPWLKLFHGTAHLNHNTENTLLHHLSGRLAIFWGLVALNIGGGNIHELERCFLFIHNHQLCLNARTTPFDRTSGRAVAVSIYRDPVDNTSLETVEATWHLA